MTFILLIVGVLLICYIYLTKRKKSLCKKITNETINFLIILGIFISISILLIIHVSTYNRTVAQYKIIESDKKLFVQFDHVNIDKVPQISSDKYQVIVTSQDGEVTVSTFIDVPELLRLNEKTQKLIDSAGIIKNKEAKK